MKVAIYGKKYKEEHKEYLDTLLEKLSTMDCAISMYEDYAAQTKKDYLTFNSHESLKDISPNLMITLGGDGTILAVTSLIRDIDLPILGINLGRLGFLASTEKNKINLALDAWANKNYRIEERTMLCVTSNFPIFEDNNVALNDFTLLKRDTSSMIKVHAYINDEFLNSYWADGLIVSTPTGSTGYSLSCGGPIIFPTSGNFAITPVAPHNLNVRPIVIPDDSIIKFTIEGRSEHFLCTLDSRFETITEEYEITVQRSELRTKLLFLPEIEFMNTIRQKLSWGFDKRNI